MAGPVIATGTNRRSYSWLVNADQWSRCAHDRTALLPDGTVELTWDDDNASSAPGSGPADCAPATPPRDGMPHDSLAFDDRCRAYRSRADRGRVDVLPTGSGGRRAPADPGRRGVLDHPSGLAVDRRSQLYVAETGGDAVRVIDTVTQTLLARVSVEGHPVDVAPDCGRALVLTRGGLDGRTGRLLVLDGRRGARPGPDLVHPCYPNAAVPVRLTSAREGAAAGCPLVLWRSPDGRAAVARSDGTTLAELDGATDLDAGPDDRLVVAFGQGRPIRDFQVQGDRLLEREPLRAPGFDGASLALAPNGRVAFTTAAGYSWTAGSAARRAPRAGWSPIGWTP